MKFDLYLGNRLLFVDNMDDEQMVEMKNWISQQDDGTRFSETSRANNRKRLCIIFDDDAAIVAFKLRWWFD